MPVLDRALAWVACELRELLPGGDHEIGVGEVVGDRRRQEGDPLVFHRGAYTTVAVTDAAASARSPAPSSGLGYETALALARRGATVALLCRSEERGAAGARADRGATGNERLHVVRCDHANLDTVRAAAAELLRRFDALHVLVNNAGLMHHAAPDHGRRPRGDLPGQPPRRVPADRRCCASGSWRRRPRASITVSSVAHRPASAGLRRPAEPSATTTAGRLRALKLANVLFTYELARRLAGTGVTANTLHPGSCAPASAATTAADARAHDAHRSCRRSRPAAPRGAHAGLAGERCRGPGRQRALLRPAPPRGARRAPPATRDQRRLWEASEALLAGMREQ